MPDKSSDVSWLTMQYTPVNAGWLPVFRTDSLLLEQSSVANLVMSLMSSVPVSSLREQPR